MSFQTDAGLGREANIDAATDAAVGAERTRVDLVARTHAAVVEDAVNERRQPRHRKFDLQIVVGAERALVAEVAKPVVLDVALRADARASGAHPVLGAGAEGCRRIPLRLERLVEHVRVDANLRDRDEGGEPQGPVLEPRVLGGIRRGRLGGRSTRQQKAKRTNTRSYAAGQDVHLSIVRGVSAGRTETEPAGAFDDARGGIVERTLLSAAGGAARRDAGADARCRRRAEQPPGRDGTVAVHVRALLDHQIIQLRRAVLKRERTCGADDLAALAVRLRILYELDQERAQASGH